MMNRSSQQQYRSPTPSSSFFWSKSITRKFLFILLVTCLPLLAKIKRVLYRGMRQMSIGLDDGHCIWTEPKSITSNEKIDFYGTLLTSYPASGMRITWQQIEGLTGIKVGDDFGYSNEDDGDGDESSAAAGIIKTQYPHYEGIWSYGSNLKQVILVIRNPRWAIPAFHKIISDMNYAQDWEGVYDFVDSLFMNDGDVPLLPDNSEWIKWRDLRFDIEIKLWSWFIDFWMEGGTQYWDKLDYERIGQHPFQFSPSTTGDKDLHCKLDMDCFPKALVVSEHLQKYETGPTELRKIADVFRGKQGMEDKVLSDEHINCIWYQTSLHHRDQNSELEHDGLEDISNGNYIFTSDQMETILKTIQTTKDKYNEFKWTTNPVAVELVAALEEYRIELEKEINEMQTQLPPTPAPDNDGTYHQYLMEWYESIGLGNRYAYEKVRTMAGYWPLVAHLYPGHVAQEGETLINDYNGKSPSSLSGAEANYEANYEVLIENPPTHAPKRANTATEYLPMHTPAAPLLRGITLSSSIVVLLAGVIFFVWFLSSRILKSQEENEANIPEAV